MPPEERKKHEKCGINLDFLLVWVYNVPIKSNTKKEKRQ